MMTNAYTNVIVIIAIFIPISLCTTHGEKSTMEHSQYDVLSQSSHHVKNNIFNKKFMQWFSKSSGPMFRQPLSFLQSKIPSSDNTKTKLSSVNTSSYASARTEELYNRHLPQDESIKMATPTIKAVSVSKSASEKRSVGSEGDEEQTKGDKSLRNSLVVDVTSVSQSANIRRKHFETTTVVNYVRSLLAQSEKLDPRVMEELARRKQRIGFWISSVDCKSVSSCIFKLLSPFPYPDSVPLTAKLLFNHDEDICKRLESDEDQKNACCQSLANTFNCQQMNCHQFFCDQDECELMSCLIPDNHIPGCYSSLPRVTRQTTLPTKEVASPSKKRIAPQTDSSQLLFISASINDNANSRNVTGEADGSADVRTTIIVISMVCTVTFVAGTAGVAVIVWLHRRSRRSKETNPQAPCSQTDVISKGNDSVYEQLGDNLPARGEADATSLTPYNHEYTYIADYGIFSSVSTDSGNGTLPGGGVSVTAVEATPRKAPVRKCRFEQAPPTGFGDRQEIDTNHNYFHLEGGGYERTDLVGGRVGPDDNDTRHYHKLNAELTSTDNHGYTTLDDTADTTSSSQSDVYPNDFYLEVVPDYSLQKPVT